MTITPEEQFRLDVMKKLGSIEDRGVRNELQLTAVNSTVAEQGQRISRLESAWSTVKVVVGFGVALVIGGIGAAVAFIKGD